MIGPNFGTVPGLVKNMVCEITYKTRDLGYGSEQETIRGFWTGDTDYTGKVTIQTVKNYPGFPRLYLFPDEILCVEELG